MLGNSQLGAPRLFAGASNLTQVWASGSFRQALVASLVFAFLTALGQILVSLGAALASKTNGPGTSILRGLLIAPFFIAVPVYVLCWSFLADPIIGLLPEGIHSMGWAVPDFRGAAWALPVSIAIAIFESFSFSYIVLLGRIMQIPVVLYEVANVSGATAAFQFWQITWPQIRTTVFSLFFLRLTIGLVKYDTPWLVYAHRAPSAWGDTLGVWIYRSAFERLQPGYAAAGSLSFLIAAWSVYAVWSFHAGREAKRL